MTSPAKNSGATWTAWAATLIASDTADICWQLFHGARLPLVWVLVRACLLLPLAIRSRGHLRGFVLTFFAFLCGSWLQRTFELHWAWFQHATTSQRIYADAWLALIPSLLVASTLFRSGLTRKEIFLTAGDPGARVTGLGSIRWSILAPAIVLLLLFGLTEQLHYILGNTTPPLTQPGSALLSCASPSPASTPPMKSSAFASFFSPADAEPSAHPPHSE